MKKLLALCLTVVLCLCCLASCGSAHEENKWFSEEKLTNCLVGDLPTIEKDYVNHNDEDIYVSFTDSEFKAYVKSVYDYLCSQEYKYLGTRGEQKNTLAGAFTTYYFEPATEFESFWNEGDYIFVFSDGSTNENGDVEFMILVIYDVSTNTLEYGNKKFTYNTQISLRRGSEAPLSGFYVLKEEEHEHTITYVSAGTTGHFENYTCGCPHDHGAVPHYDENMDLICDACGFDMNEDYPPLVDTTIPLRNLTRCEWLNELTAEDIAEIKIISGAVGVAPGNLNNVSSSTDEAVIARIFEEYYQLDARPISKMEGQVDGGGGVTVKFILKNGTAKELYINNGNYLDTNGDYFELLFTPKFKDTDNKAEAYGFITYLGTGTVYDKDNNPVCEIPIDELEFVESDDCVDAMVTGYYYTVETEFGTLYFDYSNDLFYLQFEEGEVDYIEFYRLVGKNLDELIAEYGTTTDQDSSNDIFYAAAYPQDFEYSGRHYRIVQGGESKTTATREELGDLLGYIIQEEDICAFTEEYPGIDYVIDNGIYDYETNNRVALYSLKSCPDLSIICMHQGGGYVLYQYTTDLLS